MAFGRRSSGGRLGHRLRGSPWRAAAASGCALAATAASASGVAFVAGGARATPSSGPAVRVRVGKKVENALRDAAEKADETQRRVVDATEKVISAPGKIAGQMGSRVTNAAETVANAPKKLSEALTSDDGKVLDTSSPSGFVGALAVSFAVLPYIPLSLYSSYTLATTGSGLPEGPNGIYGLAEGFATLTVTLVSLWSLVSLFTRARWLPEGPFNLLAVAQAGSFFAVACFAGATYLTTGDTSNPFKGATPEQIATKVNTAINAESVKVQKEIRAQAEKAAAPLKAAVDEKVGEVQKTQSNIVSQAQAKLEGGAAGARDSLGRAAAKATGGQQKQAEEKKEDKKEDKKETKKEEKEGNEKKAEKEETKKEEKTENKVGDKKEDKKEEKEEGKKDEKIGSFEDLFSD